MKLAKKILLGIAAWQLFASTLLLVLIGSILFTAYGAQLSNFTVAAGLGIALHGVVIGVLGLREKFGNLLYKSLHISFFAFLLLLFLLSGIPWWIGLFASSLISGGSFTIVSWLFSKI